MEALGGVASAITVLTLALQSTKVIYEVVSSVSHGSDDIDRLARATSNLQQLLENTMQLAKHVERTKSVVDTNLLGKMKPLLDQCADDLGQISRKLSQLQKDSKDRRWKKAIKHAKVYLDTKGATEIWNVVNHYVELLGTCLGNVSVNVGLYNAQKLHLFHDEVSAASRVNRSQLSQVEEILRDQRTLAQAGLGALHAELQQGLSDARMAATTQLQGIAEVIEKQQQFETVAALGYENTVGIRTDVHNLRSIIHDNSHQATVRSDAFVAELRENISKATTTLSAQIEEDRRMNAEVTQELQSISDRLVPLSNVGSEQLPNLQGLLQSLVGMLSDMQLEMRTRRQKRPTSVTTEACLTENDGCSEMKMSPDSEINRIMTKICHSAGTMRTFGYSKEAQSVIEDVGRLLGFVMQQLSGTSPSRDELLRKRKVLDDCLFSKLETELQSVENLRKAKRALTASERIRISSQGTKHTHEGDYLAVLLPGYTPNSRAEDFRPSRIPKDRLQSIVQSWTLRDIRLDAFFKNIILPDAEDKGTESADEAFAAKLLFTPISASLSNFQVVINLASRIYRNNTVYLTPTLTFHAIIPNDSEIFRLVKRGSVRRLKKLLSTGAASLGDCDSMGRSLLHFALDNFRRRMTKFLIQSGADVDFLELSITPESLAEGYHMTPLHILQMTDGRLADEDLERGEGCYKLLLDAGTDASMAYNQGSGTHDYWTSAFTESLIFGRLAKVKALLDLGQPFISLECHCDNSPDERIPLLLLAIHHSRKLPGDLQITDKIALLLSRGANVKATNPLGESCLHLVWMNHCHDEDSCWCRGEARVWRHLCRTKDIAILMISAGADVCAIDEEGRSVSDVANQSGLLPLWTDALKYCGIDIKDVLARRNSDPAYSTALIPEYSQPSRRVTSKMSLEEYLERRKAFRVPEEDEEKGRVIFDSSDEDDDIEDADLDSKVASVEDNEREDDDEEPVEKTIETADVSQKKATGEIGGTHVQYEGEIAKGKAKHD